MAARGKVSLLIFALLRSDLSSLSQRYPVTVPFASLSFNNGKIRNQTGNDTVLGTDTRRIVPRRMEEFGFTRATGQTGVVKSNIKSEPILNLLQPGPWQMCYRGLIIPMACPIACPDIARFSS